MEKNSYNELKVLKEVESCSNITQRQLSQKVGIALGLTNALLRNLIKKGYLRSQQASWKRWVYSLTPDGVAHKILLTFHYVRRFLDHYKNIRIILREQLQPLALHEESRVAILGTGEFAELVYLGLKELEISEIEVFSKNGGVGNQFLGIPIRDVMTLDYEDYDKVLVADLNGLRSESDQEYSVDISSEKLVVFFADIADVRQMS